MTTFLTVAEASRLTGKSPSSIRRIIYPIIHDDAHADRGHVEPNVAAVRELRLKGENFAWRLSEELLRREVPLETAHEPARTAAPLRSTGNAAEDLLAMLRRELDIKNQQITQQGGLIAKQVDLISGLSERLKEGNILIASLQQRLALPAAIDLRPSDPPKRKRASSALAEKGSSIAPKTSKSKKSFLARLFGSRS